MRRIFAIVVLAGLLLVAIFVLADPTFRYPHIGVQLSRPLDKLAGRDPVTLQVSLDTGTELIAEENLGDEPTVQDSFTLLMILSEEIQPQAESASVLYKVEEMQSEGWAWKQARLNKLQARTQIFESDLPAPLQITVPEQSELSESDVWTPLVAMMWPKLPSGFQKAGRASWNDQFSYQEKNPMGGDPINVNCQLLYRLENFQNTKYGIYANIQVLGTLSPASGQDPKFDVKGTFKGFCLLDPETGRVSGGEYRFEQRVLVRQPNLPVARTTTYQGVRFWRPKFHQGMGAQAPKANAPEPTATP